MLLKKFSNFKKCESGAVTADWVVLTGLIMMITLVVTPAFVGELIAGGAAVSDEISVSHTALID